MVDEICSRAVFLDRDGVLNKNLGIGRYVVSWDQWEWIAGSRKAIQLLKQAGYLVIIITNQSGISQGLMTQQDLVRIHNRMVQDVVASNGSIDRIYYCPHARSGGCNCRKPKPGMFFKAKEDFNLCLPETVFFGDTDQDRAAALEVGCQWSMVTPENPLVNAVQDFLYKRYENG